MKSMCIIPLILGLIFTYFVTVFCYFSGQTKYHSREALRIGDEMYNNRSILTDEEYNKLNSQREEHIKQWHLIWNEQSKWLPFIPKHKCKIETNE